MTFFFPLASADRAGAVSSVAVVGCVDEAHTSAAAFVRALLTHHEQQQDAPRWHLVTKYYSVTLHLHAHTRTDRENSSIAASLGFANEAAWASECDALLLLVHA